MVGAAMVGLGGSAEAGGNSDNAHLCQQGSWQTLVRADGTSFKNTGDCVSYLARGGTLGAQTSQQACEGYHGTFATGGTSINSVWTCSDMSLVTNTDAFTARQQDLFAHCQTDGGNLMSLTSDGTRAECFDRVGHPR
jgi:hypothetical protein